MEAWKNSDFPDGDETVKASTEESKEFYYDRPITDCQADLFQIRSEREICWGGYVIIGISVAVVVIIAIIIGVSNIHITACHMLQYIFIHYIGWVSLKLTLLQPLHNLEISLILYFTDSMSETKG